LIQLDYIAYFLSITSRPFPAIIFSSTWYVGVSYMEWMAANVKYSVSPLPEIPRGAILSPCCYHFNIIYLYGLMSVFLLNTACSEWQGGRTLQATEEFPPHVPLTLLPEK